VEQITLQGQDVQAEFLHPQKERILPSLQAKAEKTLKLSYEQQGKHLSYRSEAEV
jgi:hypothetical protein